jgi:tricorn protease
VASLSEIVTHTYLHCLLALLLSVLFASSASAAGTTATLMRYPNSRGDQIVFEAHGNLWTVSKTGGAACRLTTDPGTDLMPRFSPDGKWIAYTTKHGVSQDVYVIPAQGGQARQLTYDGQSNIVATWTPDSKSVVYLSRRAAVPLGGDEAFQVALEGGQPTRLPLGRAGLMTFSPDGKSIAYNRFFYDFRTWKRYDGGMAPDVYIYTFATRQLQRITDWKGLDTAPMWVGHKIYFLSDRDEHRRANIWVYDRDTRTSRAVTHFGDYDIDFPSYGDGAITFQQGGRLWAIDLPSETLHEVKVQVPDDGLRTMPRSIAVSNQIRDEDSDYDVDFSLSPNGKRAAFSGRGDIFTVPVQDGPTRNLTHTSNAEEDHPGWSPDGRFLAYTTDVTGEQQLAIREAEGGKETIITHFRNGFLYKPVWSPKGDWIAIHDGAHRLWLVPAHGGEPRQVAYNQNHYMHETDEHDAAFSPDGRWLAYSLSRPTRLRALHLYEIETGKDTEVSSPMESDYRPAFSPDGGLLYFVSNRHEISVWSDRETNAETLKSGGVYVTTLAAQGTSPFSLHSEEGATQGETLNSRLAKGTQTPHSSASADTPKAAPLPDDSVHLDLSGLMQRAVAVPVEPNKIDALDVRQDRIFYLTEPPPTIGAPFPGEKNVLHLYDLAAHKDEVVTEDIDFYTLSSDGSRVLFERNKSWTVADARPGAPGSVDLKLDDLRAQVDPRQEWAEMFENAWRLERDLFVNANMNGDNWGAVHDSYAELLPLLGSRDDLNFLIGQLIGELGSSHTYVGEGGDVSGGAPGAPAAFLGADFAADTQTGRYRVANIYAGDNTRDAYRSPLTWPGVDVHPGDYLLAINGVELLAPATPDSLLSRVTGPVELTFASMPTGQRRNYLVDPVASESRLRELAWTNGNREMVDRLSHGRIGYIDLSDLMALGMEQFQRQFYPQLAKEALVIDDRGNRGGNADQIVLERLRRVLSGMQTGRDRVPQTQPDQVMPGPKVMLINGYSGSDGDVLPFFFRSYGLGKLIGTRTWGGVRGLRTFWPLLDGGYVVVPEITFYDLQGRWAIENRGVLPDIEVDDVPGEFQQGRDHPLETAVTTLMTTLGDTPHTNLKPPADAPVYAPDGEAAPSFQPAQTPCDGALTGVTASFEAVHRRTGGTGCNSGR